MKQQLEKKAKAYTGHSMWVALRAHAALLIARRFVE